MKKFIILLVVVSVVAVGSYFIYDNYFVEKGIPVLDVEDEHVSISEYYIYGTTLNMVGEVRNIDTSYSKVDLVLYDGEFKSYDIVSKKDVNNLSFYITDELNTGLYLDDIPESEYFMFLRFSYEDKGDSYYKYYVIENNTDYDNITYYTLSTSNNMINFNSSNDYGTMELKVSKNNESEVYDVVIDPGHGGEDGGAAVGNDTEANLAMEIAEKIKEKIEASGYTVKLTREANQFGASDYFDEYNSDNIDYVGRAVIPQDVHAKYTFSIHMNSIDAKYVSGFEIYVADNINYDLAINLANNISNYVGIKASGNTTYRVSNGVYVHNFTDSEIKASLEKYDKLGYVPYDLTNKSNYLYMIRETGGYMTGAYVDDRNAITVGYNPYYNSNIGVETYLLELGYLTNSDDLDKLKNSQDKYAEAISDSIIRELRKEIVSE